MSSSCDKTKPTTQQAMMRLITQIRASFPFSLPKEKLCEGGCNRGCSLKLLEFMDMELSDWQQRLDNGEVPNFTDVQKLAKFAQRTQRVLQANGLL